MSFSGPDHVHPMQWHQAVAVSRQTCARVFATGGSPADAMAAVGLRTGSESLSWEKAVDVIAGELCTHPMSQTLIQAHAA